MEITDTYVVAAKLVTFRVRDSSIRKIDAEYYDSEGMLRGGAPHNVDSDGIVSFYVPAYVSTIRVSEKGCASGVRIKV